MKVGERKRMLNEKEGRRNDIQKKKSSSIGSTW
jgi:hypothetical protein